VSDRRGRLAAALSNNLPLAGSVPGKATFTAIFYGAEAAPRLVLIFENEQNGTVSEIVGF
jgi:hypothetical protein